MRIGVILDSNAWSHIPDFCVKLTEVDTKEVAKKRELQTADSESEEELNVPPPYRCGHAYHCIHTVNNPQLYVSLTPRPS